MRVQKNNKAFAYRVPIGDYNYLQCTLNFVLVGNDSKASIGQECTFSEETNSKVIHLNRQKFKKYNLLYYIFFF